MHDVYTGWTEALKQMGQHVMPFNLDDRLTFYEHAMMEVVGERYEEHPDVVRLSTGDRDLLMRKALTTEQAQELAVNGLYAMLYKTRPDVLLVISAFFLPLELFDLARRYGTKVVMLFTESPYEDGRQATYARHADVALLNDPMNLAHFQEITKAFYMPHAYRPSVHHVGLPVPEMECDFAFVGTGYRSRVGFLEAMNFGDLDVMLAGNWQLLEEDKSPLLQYVAHDPEECLDNERTADVYRSAKIGMNMYRREAERPELSVGLAMGPREVEMAACGLFFLRDPRPEGDQVLSMMPTFESPQEATEQLHWWLDRPGKRAQLVGEAREAIADRTFFNHAAQLMRLLDF